MSCLLTCLCTATALAHDMPVWLPIGAQPFRFGEDGRGDPGALAFHGPNGELNATVSVQRVWLQGAADGGSLTRPPRERELGVIVSVSVDPSGGGRWGASGYGRIELALVDAQGRVTHKYRACTPSHYIMYTSGYRGWFGDKLTLHIVPLPDELPVEGYVRADVMPGGGYRMSNDVFPEGYKKE